MEQYDDSALREIILARVRERGRITFADFMATSLYEPGPNVRAILGVIKLDRIFDVHPDADELVKALAEAGT